MAELIQVNHFALQKKNEKSFLLWSSCYKMSVNTIQTCWCSVAYKGNEAQNGLTVSGTSL